MTSVNWHHIYTKEPANDDQIRQVPMWSGFATFEGYAVIKGGERESVYICR